MSYRRKVLEAKKMSKKKKIRIDRDVGYVASKRQCLSKIVYPSERGVIGKIHEIANSGRKNLRYYRCNICSFYHISSKKLEGQKFIS